MTVHICRGTNVRYRGYLRGAGCRRWRLCTGPHRTAELALLALTKHFAGSSAKRGVVTMTADYYEPVPIYRIER